MSARNEHLTSTVPLKDEVATTVVPARPAFSTIDGWGALTGMSRRMTYNLLGTGDLKAIKSGGRTLVDVEHGLAYLRSLPAAQIRAPRQRIAA